MVHEVYIKRALQIGKNGLGTTRPNPMVGATIVYNNKIIGEGFTSPFGKSHAEVNAIAAVADKTLLKNSTLYVTLEPCCHHGKTPPCTDLIIQHQIPRVVIGCIDDNPEVAGKGIAKLKANGCDVIVGVLETECKRHHQRFLTYQTNKRPYIILKWAETIDGFIAPRTKPIKAPVWITNTYSRQLVHKWRAEEQAILVGTNTVTQDNPSLTVRDWNGKNPTRVILDKALKLHHNYAVFNTEADTIIIASDLENKNKENTKKNIEFIDWSKTNCIAQQISDVLFKHKINSVIIEGGAKTLQTFIDENMWNEARVFTGNTVFKDGIKAPELKGQLISEQAIAKDILKTYINN